MQNEAEYYSDEISEAIRQAENDPLAEEKIAAIAELLAKCNYYNNEGFTPGLITAIYQKKTAFIQAAKTKTELKEILKPPAIKYNGNEIIAANKYNIPEEELIVWSMTSLRAPLTAAGFDRYMKLFKEILPEAEEILKNERNEEKIMLLNNTGDTMKTEGKEYRVGMEIKCSGKSDYAGLTGKILEIRDGEDRENDENEVEIYCELYAPEDTETIEKLKKIFSEVYGAPVEIDDIGLDYTILTPEMIEFQETPIAEPVETEAESEPEPKKETNLKEKTEDEKKKEHDAAEAKRKTDFDKKQKEKKDAEEKALAEIQAISDDVIGDNSVKKLKFDIERLTRRNMKICVADHLESLCLSNPDFARKLMHPRKNMINCFKYITRLALEYIKKEREDNGEPATSEGFGGDVPDGICYQWAEDYFNDSDAPEDKSKDEEFVPKPYYGGSSNKSKCNTVKKPDTNAAGKTAETKKPADGEQLSFMEQTALDESA